MLNKLMIGFAIAAAVALAVLRLMHPDEKYIVTFTYERPRTYAPDNWVTFRAPNDTAALREALFQFWVRRTTTFKANAETGGESTVPVYYVLKNSDNQILHVLKEVREKIKLEILEDFKIRGYLQYDSLGMHEADSLAAAINH
jgi:hypothetical protein